MSEARRELVACFTFFNLKFQSICCLNCTCCFNNERVDAQSFCSLKIGTLTLTSAFVLKVGYSTVAHVQQVTLLQNQVISASVSATF